MRRADIWVKGWKKICENILMRDKFGCITCGMTNEEHKTKYKRRLTVNHINGDLDNNTDANLETLCLVCHGYKDGKRTTKLVLEPKKDEVINYYLDNPTSVRQTAIKYGVDHEVMLRSLKYWGIEIRPASQAISYARQRMKLAKLK